MLKLLRYLSKYHIDFTILSSLCRFSCAVLNLIGSNQLCLYLMHFYGKEIHWQMEKGDGWVVIIQHLWLSMGLMEWMNNWSDLDRLFYGPSDLWPLTLSHNLLNSPRKKTPSAPGAHSFINMPLSDARWIPKDS